MGDGHDRGAFVGADLLHGIVGHAGQQRGLGRVPIAEEFLAGIAHRDVEFQRCGDVRQYAGSMVRADDQQPPARAVNAAEAPAVEIGPVGRSGR
ncbi:hypothetical protein G6F68_014940 [Rhizopus microsporus]|nr:hypothetical protein G6F68_014940 [Rhizopus microsporus]